MLLRGSRSSFASSMWCPLDPFCWWLSPFTAPARPASASSQCRTASWTRTNNCSGPSQEHHSSGVNGCQNNQSSRRGSCSQPCSVSQHHGPTQIGGPGLCLRLVAHRTEQFHINQGPCQAGIHCLARHLCIARPCRRCSRPAWLLSSACAAAGSAALCRRVSPRCCSTPPRFSRSAEVVAGVRQDHPQACRGLQQHRLQDLQASRIHEVHGSAVQHQVPDQALLSSILQMQCTTPSTRLCIRKLLSPCRAATAEACQSVGTVLCKGVKMRSACSALRARTDSHGSVQHLEPEDTLLCTRCIGKAQRPLYPHHYHVGARALALHRGLPSFSATLAADQPPACVSAAPALAGQAAACTQRRLNCRITGCSKMSF